jgi:hypothetical protein
VMGAARSWKVMAVAGPCLTLLAVGALSRPAQAFAHDVLTCEWGIGRGPQVLTIAAAAVLTLAITLTFVTAAFQQPGMPLPMRILWALGLLLASPLSIPLYWFVYLRRLDG